MDPKPWCIWRLAALIALLSLSKAVLGLEEESKADEGLDGRPPCVFNALLCSTG
jgi:hypothetical protein